MASGKGGVGKSTVAVNLALALQLDGARAGLMDADIYGPSIPIMMGTREPPPGMQGNQILPVEAHGLKMMSVGFVAGKDTPVIWRGPMVHKLVSQFLSNVAWGELDYLVIDLPPGTGDAQLTLTQSAPLSGALIVTTPQARALRGLHPGFPISRARGVEAHADGARSAHLRCQLGERGARGLYSEVAWDMVRWLARHEGLLVRPSSGAAVTVARRLILRDGPGIYVAVLPDSAFKYLSDPLLAGDENDTSKAVPR